MGQLCLTRSYIPRSNKKVIEKYLWWWSAERSVCWQKRHKNQKNAEKAQIFPLLHAKKNRISPPWNFMDEKPVDKRKYLKLLQKNCFFLFFSLATEKNVIMSAHFWAFHLLALLKRAKWGKKTMYKNCIHIGSRCGRNVCKCYMFDLQKGQRE